VKDKFYQKKLGYRGELRNHDEIAGGGTYDRKIDSRDECLA